MKAARELDEVAGDLIDHARGARRPGRRPFSEYGITDANRPVEINRALRRAGLLNVYTQAGMEYLDPWTSRAFAVTDHQIAHVYVDDPADLAARPRGARRARRRRGGPRGRVAGRGAASPTSAPASSCSRRARRLVHLPLLARQRPRPGLRPPGRDPPQAGLRPRRALLGPRRREGRQAARAASPSARKKTGLPLRDERRRPRRLQVRQGHPRPPAPRPTRTRRSSSAARLRSPATELRPRRSATSLLDLSGVAEHVARLICTRARRPPASTHAEWRAAGVTRATAPGGARAGRRRPRGAGEARRLGDAAR